MKKLTLPLAIAAVLTLPALADAKPRKQSGLRGLTCGLVMRQMFGLADPALNLARQWLRFQRTELQPGAVVVSSRRGRALGGGPGGHVVKVLEVRGACTALVRDNRGTYVRDICRNQLGIVMPQGSKGSFE